MGYVLDETLRMFDVLEDGTVEGDYSFVNEPEATPVPTPEPSTPEPEITPLVFEFSTPEPTKSPAPEVTKTPPVQPPETGDDNNIKMYVIIASVAAVAGVIVLVILRKKNENMG